jgi:hypothetical protein
VEIAVIVIVAKAAVDATVVMADAAETAAVVTIAVAVDAAAITADKSQKSESMIRLNKQKLKSWSKIIKRCYSPIVRNIANSIKVATAAWLSREARFPSALSHSNRWSSAD